MGTERCQFAWLGAAGLQRYPVEVEIGAGS